MADVQDDAKLRSLLQDNGFDWDAQRQRFQARSEQLQGPYPTPVEVLNVGAGLGIIWSNIPWATIAKYLICVFTGIWTKPLPQAAADCAKSLGLIPSG